LGHFSELLLQLIVPSRRSELILRVSNAYGEIRLDPSGVNTAVRSVGLPNGRFRYIPNAPDWHVLFGWLQVERRIHLTAVADIPP